MKRIENLKTEDWNAGTVTYTMSRMVGDTRVSITRAFNRYDITMRGPRRDGVAARLRAMRDELRERVIEEWM